jgi:putative transcriptional regulator
MEDQTFNNLSGKVLIASPYTLYSDVFHKSLIYILSHTPDGASGLIVNHLMSRMPLKSLFHSVNDTDPNINNMILSIYLGGPIELEKGFFLHSDEYDKNLLFKSQNNIAISSNTDILKDIAAGVGPKHSLFIVGYTAWKAGQLELELENNFWIVSECNPELIFSEANDQKWHIALKNLGIEDAHFSAKLGHC